MELEDAGLSFPQYEGAISIVDVNKFFGLGDQEKLAALDEALRLRPLHDDAIAFEVEKHWGTPFILQGNAYRAGDWEWYKECGFLDVCQNVATGENPYTSAEEVVQAKMYLKDYEAWKERRALKLQREQERLHKPGHVYILRAPNGLCKIGQSSNVLNRFKGLETSSPVKLEPVLVIATETRTTLERQLHEQFAGKRQHGEWFALNEVDISELSKVYAGALMQVPS